MGTTTGIQWTEKTWNPLVGCTKVSPGCDHCYAETQVDNRLHPAALAVGGKNLEAFPTPFATVSLRPDRFLMQPLTWKKPARIFVNSLSDLFHDQVPMDFIARVFAVMALAPQHTFQLLTKRHGRMRTLLNRDSFRAHVGYFVDNGPTAEDRFSEEGGFFPPEWPLPNVWLGVSAEDQRWYTIRVQALMDTPAAVRWVSAEPLLGPISQPFVQREPIIDRVYSVLSPPEVSRDTYNYFAPEYPDWVVVGGESGPGARLCELWWIESLITDLELARVPVFVKQTGTVLARQLGLAHHKGGDSAEWPEQIKVRGYPAKIEVVTTWQTI
jgi:protein gp37